MLPIGVSPLRFDQLTHHFASCVLSLKTVHVNLCCVVDISNCHSILLGIGPFPSIKALRFGNHCPCGSCKLIGKCCHHNAVGPALQEGLDPERIFAAGKQYALLRANGYQVNVSVE
jgi:hypothetical protein